jgi:hypothetical protein
LIISFILLHQDAQVAVQLKKILKKDQWLSPEMYRIYARVYELTIEVWVGVDEIPGAYKKIVTYGSGPTKVMTRFHREGLDTTMETGTLQWNQNTVGDWYILNHFDVLYGRMKETQEAISGANEAGVTPNRYLSKIRKLVTTRDINRDAVRDRMEGEWKCLPDVTITQQDFHTLRPDRKVSVVIVNAFVNILSSMNEVMVKHEGTGRAWIPSVGFLTELTKDHLGIRRYSYASGMQWLPKWELSSAEWAYVIDEQREGKYGLIVLNLPRRQWTYIDRSSEWRDREWMVYEVIDFVEETLQREGGTHMTGDWAEGAIDNVEQKGAWEWTTGITVMRDMETLMLIKEIEHIMLREEVDIQRIRIAEMLINGRMGIRNDRKENDYAYF